MIWISQIKHILFIYLGISCISIIVHFDLERKQQWNFFSRGWQRTRVFNIPRLFFIFLQLFHALKQNCVSRCMYNVSWTVNVFWRFESCLDNKNNNCDHAIARIQSQITHKQMDVLSGISYGKYRTYIFCEGRRVKFIKLMYRGRTICKSDDVHKSFRDLTSYKNYVYIKKNFN